MMLPIHAALLSFVAATSGIGVQSASVNSVPTEVIPVFDCYRINFAWGFKMSGRMIDQDGTIYHYEKSGKAWLPKPIAENNQRFIGMPDLKGKYAQRSKAGSVDTAILATKANLIAAAAGGNIVTQDGGARDAGSSSCHAYLADSAQHRYRDIDLGSDGGVNDVRHSNTADAAKSLLEWLKSVGVAN